MFHPEGPTFWELTRQALSSTRRGYDLLAPKFDLTPYRTPEAVVAGMTRDLGEVLSALDVCCGTGAGLEALAGRPGLTRLVGVDFSQGMLEQARTKLAGCEELELIHRDVLEMDFDGEFDLAICLGALGHFVGDDYASLMRNIYRALRPGGRFVFPAAPAPRTGSLIYWYCLGFNAALRMRNLLLKPEFVMYYHPLMFDGPELRALLEETGFQVTGERLGQSVPSDGLEQLSFNLITAQRPGPLGISGSHS